MKLRSALFKHLASITFYMKFQNCMGRKIVSPMTLTWTEPLAERPSLSDAVHRYAPPSPSAPDCTLSTIKVPLGKTVCRLFNGSTRSP